MSTSETITQASNKLTEKWNELPKKHKIQLIIGLFAIIISTGVVIFMFTRPTTSILYSNLDMEAVSQITEVLDAENITYELIRNGNTIQLNEEDINRAKIVLTRADVPQGDYTFDDAITSSLSTTEAEKRSKMIYLTQTNLENILANMSDIRSATVQLNIPEEKNSFLASKMESSASVVLTLNQPLAKSQITGIANLIARAVENLKPENITILDSDSNVLFNGSDSMTFQGDDQQSLKLAAEESTKNKVIALLSPIYDEITISSNMILAFDHFQETKESFTSPIADSPSGLLRESHTTNGEGSNSVSGDAPGMDTNAQDVPGVVAGDANLGDYSYTTTDNYYDNNKIISSTIKSVGDINYDASSLAVNVFSYKVYDQNLLESTLPEGLSWEQYKADNEAHVPLEIDPAIITAIQKGTGITDIAVVGYEKPVFIDVEPYIVEPMDYVPYALLVGFGLIIVLVVVKFKKPKEVIEVEPELQVEEVLQMVREQVQASEEENEEEAGSLQDIEVREALETKKRIEKFIDEKPEAVASLLRNWLDDEWGEDY